MATASATPAIRGRRPTRSSRSSGSTTPGSRPAGRRCPRPRGRSTAADGGEAIGAPPTDTLATLAYTPPAGQLVRVSTAYLVGAINPPGGNATRNAGLVHRFNPPLNEGTACLAVLDQGNASSTLWLLELKNVVTRSREPFGAFAVGARYEMTTEDVLMGGQGALRCASTTGAMGLELSGAAVSPGAAVGFRTRGTTTRLSYLVVIGRAP